MKGIAKRTSRMFKALTAVALLLSLTLVAFVGCGSEDETSNTNTASSSDENNASSIASEDYGISGVESVDENNSSSSESVESTESSPADDSSSDDSSVPENSEDTSSPEDTSDTSSESSSDEEILGAGTEDDPYLEIPDEDRTVTTETIPAGETQFYAIYRVGGAILTIENGDAYIIYNGKTYNAKNGKVTLTVENALASDSILFEIGNKGSDDAVFIIKFATPTGSQSNPTVIESIGEEYTVSLEADEALGYFYQYIAEKDGTIRFYFTASVDSAMTVNRIRDTIPVQISSDENPLTDENGNTYFEVEVLKGDEVVINLCAKPNKRGKYPAAEITWSAMYA